MSAASDPSQEAAFVDGVSARRHAVRLRLEAGFLHVEGQDGPLAAWRLAEIRRIDAPAGMMRLALADPAQPARLEVVEPALRTQIVGACPALDRSVREERRASFRIVVWSLAAAVSLVLTAVFLVPLLADRIAPLVPLSWERHLGTAVDNQIRTVFQAETCSDAAGKAALATLAGRLEGQARLGRPLSVEVLSSDIPNAFALPGDRIYVMNGLLRNARSVDEVAGVLAHEIGHAAHRDGLRRLLQTGGTSFLFGLLLGDVTGSGVVILIGRHLIDSAYSRDSEAAADAYAGRVMAGLGRPAAPMAELLVRLTGEENRRYGLLRSHPFSQDRLARLRALAPEASGPPLLDESQWQALRGICSSQG